MTAITLRQFVSHLRRSGDTLAVELSLGPLELGGITVSDGLVWHAETPGAHGDDAWSLLSLLGRCDAHVRPLTDAQRPPRSVKATLPLDALDAHSVAAAEEARQRRTMKLGSTANSSVLVPRLPLASASQLSLPPAPLPSTRDSTLLDDPQQRAYEELFRNGTQCYVRSDYKGALESFEACLRLRPDDVRVLHNIERLKTRLGSAS